MKFVRLCGREGTPKDPPRLICTKWMPETVTLLYDLRALKEAGNDVYGEGTHWIETVDNGNAPDGTIPTNEANR